MIFGLAFLGLSIFCGFKSYKLHKDLYPGKNFLTYVDVEDESLIPLDPSLSPNTTPTAGGPKRRDSSDSDFGSKPVMEQEERVFNLVG